MFNFRRIYIYLVTAVSLNAVTWAVIALLRNLLMPRFRATSGIINYNKEMIAMQFAIVILGLPIYLAHWLWAERLAQREEKERDAVLRWLYLYGMLTAFLAPFLANAYSFLKSTFRLLFDINRQLPSWSSEVPDNPNLIYTVAAMFVLAVLWSYHYWLIRTSRRAIAEDESIATLQRLYVFLFSFTGLVILSIGIGNLLRWLLFRFGGASVAINKETLVVAFAQILVGLPLWLLFWWQAQQLFSRGRVTEQASTLRKFYLYLVIFLAAMGTVGSLTTLLAGLFQRMLSLESDGDVRNVLCVLITTAVVWAYHFVVLRQDALAMPEVKQQAGIRRLYWYLIAGIGLMALLIGLGSDMSVLIRSFSGEAGYLGEEFLQEQMAWSSAILLAGLLVWIVPWQKIQMELSAPEPIGNQAHQSWARKIYLYFYLLLATFTFLGTGVYILSQIVLLAMGGRTSRSMVPDMAHAIAFALMAVTVWSYHISLIRRDNKALQTASSQLAKEVHVVVVDDDDGRFGQKLIAALQQAIPDIILHPLGLTTDAVKTLNNVDNPPPTSEILENAQIIVGPWTMATPYVIHGDTDMNTLVAISSSPGHKLLIPKPEPDWDWSGVGEWESETAVKQTICSVKQLIAGKSVKTKKGYSLGTAIAIGFGIFVLINLLPLLFLIPLAFFGY